MKNIVFFIAGIVIASAFVTTTVLAEDLLPRISTVCEMKNGFLVSYDDGFSVMNDCPEGSRRVVLIGEKGEQGPPGPQGPAGTIGAGNTKFINVDGGAMRVLTPEGQILSLAFDSQGEVIWEDTGRDIPMPSEDVLQWENDWLLDINGDIWRYPDPDPNGEWVNYGQPGN